MTEDKDTKEKPASEPEQKKEEIDSAAIENVKNRLKFFFSNANVRQDFFVRKQLMKEDGDLPHMVSIENLLKFNTIKQYTTEASVVVDAAKALSDFLVLDEKETGIGRVEPFTASMMDDNIPLTLYIRNVPMVEKEGRPVKYEVSVDEMRALFEPYGDVALVKLKYSHSRDSQGDEELGLSKEDSSKKTFKRKKFPIGHALVEYHKVEDVEKAAADLLTMKGGEKQDPKRKLTVGESKQELSVMLLSEYIAMRKKEKEQEGENGKNVSGKKHDRDETEDDKDDEVKEMPTFKLDWKPGCVIRLTGLPDSCDREAILDTVAKGLEISVGEVKARNIYVDYSRGQSDGAIRFAEFADYITKVADRLKGGELLVADAKVEDAKVLEGAEEEEYWTKFIEFKNKQLQHKEEEKRARKKRKKGGHRY